MGELDDAVGSLYSVIEESAGLVGVKCSPDAVMPILAAYGDGLADAVVAFRVGTGRAKDLDCRFTIAPGLDPYALAVSRGFVTPAGHPVDVLLDDIAAACPVDSYGIDFGVVGGFKKIWLVLPRGDLQPVADLARIASMPPALAANTDFFTRHHLGDKAGLLGIDYRNKTVNVYFGEQPATCFEPGTIRSMLDQVGRARPSEQLLLLAQQAFGIYVTLNWDTAELERICFAVATPDPTGLSVPLDPAIERFIRHVQRSQTDRKFVYAVASSPEGEYYKLQSYYRWRPEVMDIMQLSNGTIKDPV